MALTIVVWLAAAAAARAQEPAECRALCAPSFKVEPTITFPDLFGSPRIQDEDGQVTRESRDPAFEVIFAAGLPTRLAWLAFTVEAIVVPFDDEATPEVEFEANVIWLSSVRTRGWVTSHVDIVDKFSPSERPGDDRAYTHKLNLELDTSLAIFNWLPERRWLRGLELEGSLDYVATGLPKAGDPAGGGRYLDDASPWSFSVVFVLPVAPF